MRAKINLLVLVLVLCLARVPLLSFESELVSASPDPSWNIETVGNGIGGSIALDSHNRPHICHSSCPDFDLKYAKSIGTTGEVKPYWVSVNSYAKYQADIRRVEEGVTYVSSGTYTITVKEVHEDYAVLGFVDDMMWSPSPPPDYVSEQTWDLSYRDLEHMEFVLTSSVGLGFQVLENMKAGILPEELEKYYKGIKNLTTAYGTVKCFHFAGTKYDVEFSDVEFSCYWDYDTGLAIKHSGINRSAGFEAELELLETNIRVAAGELGMFPLSGVNYYFSLTEMRYYVFSEGKLYYFGPMDIVTVGAFPIGVVLHEAEKLPDDAYPNSEFLAMASSGRLLVRLPDGRRLGSDGENTYMEIENGFYNGPEENIQLIVFPTPEQNYEIQVWGVEEGEYDLHAVRVGQGEYKKVISKQNVPTEPGKMGSYVIEVEKLSERPMSWLLIGGIIAIVIIIVLAILYKRRR